MDSMLGSLGRRVKHLVPHRLRQAYPDLPAIAARANPQADSTLFQLSAELRCNIYEHIWRAAGVSQHILCQDGRYCCSPCITDHSAEDIRHDEDAWAGRRDPRWLRALTTQCSNHWRCEELFKAEAGNIDALQRRTAARARHLTPFLPMLLACRRLYIECRASIFESISFVFIDPATALDFFTIKRLPIIHDIRALKLSFRLTVRPHFPDEIDSRPLWHDLCKELARLPSLVEANAWLTTYRTSRSLVQWEPDVFACDPKLAAVVSVNVPATEDELRDHGITAVEPRYRIQLRNSEIFVILGGEAIPGMIGPYAAERECTPRDEPCQTVLWGVCARCAGD